MIRAVRPEDFPPEDVAEIAFLGRSNVGKSTLLNSLAGCQLARTSSTPGRTQAIHFYPVGTGHRFVDLPGYGYAKVSREVADSWKPLVESYLRRRQSLALCLVLLDARRGWMEKDLELKQWLEHYQRRYLVIATKTDKYRTQKEKYHGLAGIRAVCPNVGVIPFSAVTGQGVREIWQAISKINSKT